VNGQNEADSSSLLQRVFGHRDGLNLVGHEHEREAKQNELEFVFQIFVDVIEVHLINSDVLFMLQSVLCLESVLVVDVHTDDLGVLRLEVGDDGLERGACAAANIEKVASQFGHVGSHDQMGGDCEEFTDEDIVEESFESVE
jgi:hypothetical protein